LGGEADTHTGSAFEADERAENAGGVHTLVDTVGREELPGSGQKLNEHTDALPKADTSGEWSYRGTDE
jgi:hypothetical protein